MSHDRHLRRYCSLCLTWLSYSAFCTHQAKHLIVDTITSGHGDANVNGDRDEWEIERFAEQDEDPVVEIHTDDINMFSDAEVSFISCQ